MKIPVGRYVNLKPQYSEMCSGYAEGAKRDRKGERDLVNKEIVEHLSCYVISLNHS
jgi:hypothetical protein